MSIVTATQYGLKGLALFAAADQLDKRTGGKGDVTLWMEGGQRGPKPASLVLYERHMDNVTADKGADVYLTEDVYNINDIDKTKLNNYYFNPEINQYNENTNLWYNYRRASANIRTEDMGDGNIVVADDAQRTEFMKEEYDYDGINEYLKLNQVNQTIDLKNALPDVSPEIQEEIKRRIELLQTTNDAKYRESYMYSGVRGAREGVDFLTDAGIGAGFKALGNLPSMYQELRGLGLLGKSKLQGVGEEIEDYFNPSAEQRREDAVEETTANGFIYNPESDASISEALAKERFLLGRENRENIDNHITYRSALMGSHTVSSATETVREMLIFGKLLEGRVLFKGDRLAAIDPLTLPNMIKNPKSIFDVRNPTTFDSIYDTAATAEISKLAGLTYKQRLVTLKDAGTTGFFAGRYKALPIVGQAARHDHLFSMAGVYGPEAKRFSQRLYQYGNLGAALSGTSIYVAQLQNPESTWINNGWFTVGAGLFGGVSAPFLGMAMSQGFNKFSAAVHLSYNPLGTQKNLRMRTDRYLQYNKEMPPELLDELNGTIDAMPDSAIPAGRFNENGKIYKDGYLHDEFIKGSPRLNTKELNPDGTINYGTADEIAYANAQKAYNKKMNVIGMNDKGVKNVSKFISMVHKLRDAPKTKPLYERLMTEVEATNKDIDTLRGAFFDADGRLKPKYEALDADGKPVINAEDLEDLDMYLDMYMGNTMLAQFTDMMQEAANLGIFGKNIDSLFANDYLEMLGAMEGNLAKLSNMHAAIVKTMGVDDAGNPNTEVLEVLTKLDDGRKLQTAKFQDKYDFIDAELDKLQIRTDSEMQGFSIDDIYDLESSIGKIDVRRIPSLKKYESKYTKITGSSRSTRETDMNVLGEEILEVIRARYDDVFGESGTMKDLYNNVKKVKTQARGEPEGTFVYEDLKILDFDTPAMRRVKQAALAGEGTDTPDAQLVMDPHWQGINSLFKKGGAPVKRTFTPTDANGKAIGEPIEIYVDVDTTMDDLLRVRSQFRTIQKEKLTSIEGHDAGENAIDITRYLDDSTREDLQAANKAYLEASENWKGGIGRQYMDTDKAGSGAPIETRFTIYDTLIEGMLADPDRLAGKLDVFFDSREAGIDYLTKALAHRIHMGRKFSEDDFSKIDYFFAQADKFETSGGELLSVNPVTKTPILGKETLQFSDKVKDLKDMYGARQRIGDEVGADIRGYGRSAKNIEAARLEDEGNLQIIFKGMDIGKGRRDKVSFYQRLNNDGIDGINELKESFFGGGYSGTLTEADFDNAILHVVKEQLELQFRAKSKTARVIPKVSKVGKDGLTKDDKGWIEQLNIEADGYQQVLADNKNIIEYLETIFPSVGKEAELLKDIQLLTRSSITQRGNAPKGNIRNIPSPTSFSTYQSYGWAWARGVVGSKWIAAQLGRTHIANTNAKMYVQVLTDPDAKSLLFKITNGKTLKAKEKIRFKDYLITMLPTLREVYGDMTEGERMSRTETWEKKIDAYVDLAARGGIPDSLTKPQ